MKIVSIIRNKAIHLLIFVLIGILTNGQEIKIWNKPLNINIIINQQVREDSVYLSIEKKDNKWLGRNVNIKTVNYWSNAPIEVTADCCKKNFLIIKRMFLGNNIVGDRLYFKRNKDKYYFKVLKEFEQKTD
ncbi:hypothetical protein C1631_013000 [Chryseobacterium phosphatilyticum]|uniref:Uncharacterized protein n=1 Tax=Chryseobacterium phosphatilyticum TaxID=475075 RepID=A0A316X9M2_9FLAO|nr:hypothetical protein [Chryseobacterium phosphatilyticum]PWN68983.1 hypothetical protein C1631_013000 [Chryseobacterium phosphatilyticum]